ncbi:MAG: hypothetical protein AB7E32_00445 [Desulfovibrio sp.]
MRQTQKSRPKQGKRSPYLTLWTLLFCVGCGLLLLNITGVVWPNDKREALGGIVLSYEQASDKLEQLAHGSEPNKQAVTAIMNVIHDSMHYTWPQDEGTVPLRENWILYLGSFFDSQVFKFHLSPSRHYFSQYQYFDYDKALRRGFGICSQIAMTLSGFLEEKLGIPYQVLGLEGHVCTVVQLPDGTEFVADPSANVIIPWTIDSFADHMADISEIYQQTQYPKLAALYDDSGNTILPSPRIATPTAYALEKYSYRLIWIIPFLLQLPMGLYLVSKNVQR